MQNTVLEKNNLIITYFNLVYYFIRIICYNNRVINIYSRAATIHHVFVVSAKLIIINGALYERRAFDRKIISATGAATAISMNNCWIVVAEMWRTLIAW